MKSTTEFRKCLGKFATGVTVVTCVNKYGDACGITANSFSSVSLDPPLVLWNIAKVSNSLDAYLQAEYFAINVLSDAQQAVSSHFAQADHTIFDGYSFSSSPNGVPLLDDTLACLECRTTQIHEAGDHFIIVGLVESFTSTEQKPLVFFDGAYTSLS
jgi:flavin reductase (DIM6/NTAB) family NADH-FMN oxidoreductase RutF